MQWLLLSLPHISSQTQKINSFICPAKCFPLTSPQTPQEGEASCSQETELKRSEMKGEELSSSLQWHYYQIAWCKKLLPPPSHYVYLARTPYVEQFSDSATEAAFSTCTDCSGTGNTSSLHVARVTEPSSTAGGKLFASREMWSALLIFTSTGISGTGTNSVSVLVKKFLLMVAKCSIVW